MKWIFKSELCNPFPPTTMIISVRFQNNHDIYTSQIRNIAGMWSSVKHFYGKLLGFLHGSVQTHAEK